MDEPQIPFLATVAEEIRLQALSDDDLLAEWQNIDPDSRTADLIAEQLEQRNLDV